jgi:hypothetical protein
MPDNDIDPLKLLDHINNQTKNATPTLTWPTVDCIVKGLKPFMPALDYWALRLKIWRCKRRGEEPSLLLVSGLALYLMGTVIGMGWVEP